MARCSPLAGGCNLIMEKSLLESHYSDIIYIYIIHTDLCVIFYIALYIEFFVYRYITVYYMW